jgi:hypothetical protein
LKVNKPPPHHPTHPTHPTLPTSPIPKGNRMSWLAKILTILRENPVYVYLLIGLAIAFGMFFLALVSVLL